MGHVRLGRLPKTRKWSQVIGLLSEEDANAAEVALATLRATRDALGLLDSDPALSYCLWLLSQITTSASTDRFGQALARLGVEVREQDSAIDLLARVAFTADSQLRSEPIRSAFTELAQAALREVLTNVVGEQAQSLFDSTLEDARRACKRYSTQKQFGVLIRRYFGSFLSRTLRFVVDKEISNHVGPNRSFKAPDAVATFADDLDAFAYQTAKIVEDYAGAWYSKYNWLGGISKEDTRKFTSLAIRKLVEDLRLSGQQI